ncbi:hypothetical protein ACWCOV_26865 [Kribbella sp. NPDC002412]
MSKKVRERRRQQRREAAAASARQLTIAVVTTPQSAGRTVDVRHEVELIKSAMLYADKVELFSPAFAMIGYAALVAERGSAGFAELFATLSDDEMAALLREQQLAPEWRGNLTYLRDPQTEEQRRQVAAIEAELHRTIQGLLVESGADELAPAFEAGILSQNDSMLATDGDHAGAFVGELTRLLGDSSMRLLLDGQTGELARALIDENTVSPGHLSLKHAQEALLGSGLVARLPAFHQAPTNELLDLRADLSGPLTRYRAAVAQLANKMTAPAFSGAGAGEIDDMWLTDVAPALLEIEESLAEHTLAKEIARSVGKDIGSVIKGLTSWPAIYIGLEAVTDVRTWIAAAVAAAPTVATHLTAAVTGRADGQGRARSHELFYLYEADHRLTEQAAARR